MGKDSRTRRSKVDLYIFYIMLTVGVALASLSAAGLAIAASKGEKTATIVSHNYTVKLEFTAYVEKSIIYSRPIIELGPQGSLARKLTRDITVRAIVYRDGNPANIPAEYTVTSYVVLEPFKIEASKTHVTTRSGVATVDVNVTKLRSILAEAEHQIGIPPGGREEYMVQFEVRIPAQNRTITLKPTAFIASENPYVYSLSSKPDSTTVKTIVNTGNHKDRMNRPMLLSMFTLGLLLSTTSTLFYIRYRRQQMDSLDLVREKAPLYLEGIIAVNSQPTIFVDNLDTLLKLASRTSSPVIVDNLHGIVCNPLTSSIMACYKLEERKTAKGKP